MKYRVRVVQDDTCFNPREDFDHLGTMVCWHGRYILGDEQPNISPDEYLESLPEAVILPLYLYDHSGITMRTSSFSCPWDSGQVGFIYVTMNKIREEYGPASEEHGSITEEYIERVKECLIAEVQEYDYYIMGAVYGFIIEEVSTCECCGTEEFEDYDSCFGFLGFDPEENGMLDAVEPQFHDAIIEAMGSEKGIDVEIEREAA